MTLRSMPEELYHAFQRGEIPREDYEIGTSVWVAENVIRYSPLSYLPLPQGLTAYAHSRIGGDRPRDLEQHAAIARWLMSNVKIHVQNRGDFRLLEWAKERCLAVGLVRDVQNLDVMIHQHRSNDRFVGDVILADRVYDMDAKEKP